MELLIPRFIEEGYDRYTDEGMTIAEDAPAWAKKEYAKFIKELNKGELV